MVKVAIIYYSMYGHIKTLVEAAKETLSGVAGLEVSVFQVAETLPAEVLAKMHAPPKADYPVIDQHNLADYDAFVFAYPTRFGAPAAQFKAFVDSTGQLWQKGALVGKPYTCITSSASLGAQETTILAAVLSFTSHGMVFVPSGYICPGTQFDMSEQHGGSPWGAGTLAGPDGSRQPTTKEIDHVKAQAAHFAGIAKKLAA